VIARGARDIRQDVDVTGGDVRRDQLAAAAHAARGAGRRLIGASRLRGGSKKGVYRLTFNDATTAIAYVWADAENSWPGEQISGAEKLADPLSPASGLDLFEAAHRCLESLGIRTPRVWLIDRSQRYYPADIAVVEDVPGESLEGLLRRRPRDATETLERLARTLERMHKHRAPGFGKVALIEGGGAAPYRSCEQVVHERALGDLAEAAARDARIMDVRDRLEDTIHALAAAVRPRSEYGLIHGELGPDHVLVDRSGDPVLIDIEGLMYFDVEWEHAYLRMRFGEQYRRLREDGLDERRLAFYPLAMRLSLVAGPLRLLDGGFPDRDAMMKIAEHNLRQVLAFPPEGGRRDG
jgi:hypothetical protein